MGGSIKPTELDVKVAHDTMFELIQVLQPNLVLFVSKKAYKTAKSSGLFDIVSSHHNFTPHPCSPHWNRSAKNYGKLFNKNLGPMSGKQRFIEIINHHISLG
jgi:hypothetical protein